MENCLNSVKMTIIDYGKILVHIAIKTYMHVYVCANAKQTRFKDETVQTKKILDVRVNVV